MVEAFLGRHVRGDKILYAVNPCFFLAVNSASAVESLLQSAVQLLKVFCSINCLNRKDQNEEIKQVLHGFGFYCSVWQVAKITNIY